jgi:hypothetical protein
MQREIDDTNMKLHFWIVIAKILNNFSIIVMGWSKYAVQRAQEEEAKISDDQ